MKKFLVILLSCVLIVSGISCSSTSSSEESTDKEFDIKKAEAVVNNYMNLLQNDDYQGASNLYTNSLKKKERVNLSTDLKIKGYNITETNQIGQSGMFKVRVARTNLSKTAASLDEYTLKVIMEKWNYKIDDIKSTVEKEVFVYKDELRVRNTEGVKNFLLIQKDQFPRYSFSKDDKTNLYKLDVPLNNYGTADISYSGEMVSISTYDRNSFVGIVKIDDTLATAGGDSSSQGSAGGGGGAEQQGTGPREKPIGKNVTALDILREAKVDYQVFSPDEKFLIVQYTSNNNMKNLRLYTTANGDIIPFRFEDNFNTENVDIIYKGFNKSILLFTVVPKPGKESVEKQTSGNWQLDLEKFKAKKE